MMPHYRPFSLMLVAVLMASLTTEAAMAAEWVAQPSATLRGEFNDNFRLTTAEHGNVWGAILDPRLTLSRRTELWEMSATGRLRAGQYSGQDGLNNVDNFLDVGAKRRFERGSLEANAALSNDTTFQNQVLDFDTGLSVTQIDRRRRRLDLSGVYMFSEASRLEPSIGYSTLSYGNDISSQFSDYELLTPSLRIVHQYSPRTQVFGVLTRSKATYDNASNLESTTDSLQLGASYNISEVWILNGSIGRRRTNNSFQVTDRIPRPGLEAFFPFISDTINRSSESESTGLVYNVSLSRTFETGLLSLSASRSSAPSSSGVTIDSTNISLNGQRKLSAKLSANLAVSYYQSAGLDGDPTPGGATINTNTDQYRIAPSLAWQLDEGLTLSSGYTYTRVKRGSLDSLTADSNAVFVSLGYSWPRMSVSR